MGSFCSCFKTTHTKLEITVIFKGKQEKITLKSSKNIKDLRRMAAKAFKTPKVADMYVLKRNGKVLEEEDRTLKKAELLNGMQLKLE